jgi:amidohydrolase
MSPHRVAAATVGGHHRRTAQEGAMALDDRLRDDALALRPDLVALRHRLHEHPELGLELPVTQRTVLAAIDGLGLEVSTGSALSSVTAVLRGGGRPSGRAGGPPTVLLRGDMDALPVTEATGLDYASKVAGVMHACGHDLHTAMLVGAARLLSAHRDELPGDVVFMFQPGEEGWDGARYMLDEGVLDAAGRRVDSAYGIHVLAARIPRGAFATRPGTLMAASAALRVTVHGAGGHGSAPHLARDPITAAAEMVTALQTLITRRFDVFDPVVLTVGTFAAGTKRNIIPDDARFEATVRTFSDAAHDRIAREAPELCRRIAAAYGMEAEVEFADEYPVTVNDAAHAAFAADVVREVFGDERGAPMPNPQTGSEDFSRVLDAVPGCYLFLGAHPGDEVDVSNNHSPRAMFDDVVLPDGVLLHAQLAIRALRRDAVAVGAS